MKIKRKNIKKNKFDVWLKTGEIGKYIKIKKYLCNKIIKNKCIEIQNIKYVTIINCKFLYSKIMFKEKYENITIKNCKIFGSYGYLNENNNYLNREKYKNKGL